MNLERPVFLKIPFRVKSFTNIYTFKRGRTVIFYEEKSVCYSESRFKIFLLRKYVPTLLFECQRISRCLKFDLKPALID